MLTRRRALRSRLPVWCAIAFLGLPALAAAQPFVLTARGGVEIWSEPQPNPGPGLRATKLVLRTEEPADRIVTFENIAITGDVHQVFDTPFQFPTPNPDTLVDSTLFNGSWGDFDSHLLLTPSMIGGGAGGGFNGISESNDGSLGSGGLPKSSGGFDARTGIGDLAMAAPTDAFFLDTPFQTNEVDFAYVVTPVAGGDVLLTLGVLGSGFVNSGQPGGANWGFNGVAPVDVLFRNPASASCTATPRAACRTAAKSQLQIKDQENDAKDQLKWNWQKGAEVLQADLGDPLATTAYALCVYDGVDGTPELVAEALVDPNPGWKSKDPKGWQYKDKTGAEDGIVKVTLKTGPAEKSKLQLQGKGASLPLPAPVDASEFFDQDPAVTVQLVNDEGTCWTSTFFVSGTKKNDPGQFKAKAP